MSAEFYILSKSKKEKLNKLFFSRMKLTLSALVLEILTFFFFARNSLFIIGLFNAPAIIALLSCLFQSQLSNHQFQSKTKLLLKVGIAKALGGVLLAIYMGFKYAMMLNNSDDATKGTIKFCAICLGGGAFIDIVYSLIAYQAIKSTRNIIKIIKRRPMETCSLRLPSEKSTSGLSSMSSSDSTSCSEEDSPRKYPQRCP